jgi:ATP-dependent Lon protease
VDLEEIPEPVRRDLTFHAVDRLDQALKLAFPEAGAG